MTHPITGPPEALLAALRAVMTQCDGARTRDGRGFSKFDVWAAHSLLHLDALTPLELDVARYLVFRYRCQIPLPLLTAALGDHSLADLKGALG